MPEQDSPSDTVDAAVADRLNNALTGIALKSGLLRARSRDQQLKLELQELEDLALEAVALLRQLVPAP